MEGRAPSERNPALQVGGLVVLAIQYVTNPSEIDVLVRFKQVRAHFCPGSPSCHSRAAPGSSSFGPGHRRAGGSRA
jgi:hypothetical protein